MTKFREILSCVNCILITIVLSNAFSALGEVQSNKQIIIRRNSIEAEEDQDGLISKCCPLGHGLWRIVDSNETIYQCFNPSEDIVESNFTFDEPLMTFSPNDVQIGFPKSCEGLLYREIDLKSVNDIPYSYCLDKIMLTDELNDDVETQGQIVVLTCEKVPKLHIKPNILSIRKCCKDDMLYDPFTRSCANATEDSVQNGTDFLEGFISPDTKLIDLNYGLRDCRSPLYAIDYVQDYFEIQLHGAGAVVKHRETDEILQMDAGTFCLDGTVDGALVVRGCRENCDLAVCITKCCAEGEVYVRNNCKRGPRCAKISEVSEFVPEFYEETNKTLVKVEPPETSGVRYGVMCPEGKFKLERNPESSHADYHYLERDTGYLIMPHYPIIEQKHFCMEVTNQDACGLGTHMETLMCFAKPVDTNKFAFMSIGAMISSVFLFMTILVYAAIPELRNLHGKTLMCHAVAMLVAYACLSWVQSTKIYEINLCIALGYTIYFSFVSAFCWLNVMCFDIWWTFGSARTIQVIRRPGVERRRFFYYSLYAWGLSLLLTGITVTIDFRNSPEVLDPDIGRNSCWFGSKKRLPHYILFVLPMGLQILTNCALFILTAIHCNKVKSEIHRLQAGSMGERCKRRFLSDKAKYTLNLKLFIVMGMTWFLEFVSNVFSQPEELWYVADFLNLLQGVPIFCILVLKRKVYRLIRKKLGCERADKRTLPGGSSTTTTGLSSGLSGGYKNGRICSTSSYGSERNSTSMRPITKSLTVTQEDDVITLKTS